jgi:hypothetical protein
MKKRILVSHEFPISMMEQGRDLIDYCFCLPHLLDQSKEYENYFRKSKELGRYIIMDNSLHELKDTNGGKPYDIDRLWYWMNELQPNEFIVPDYWMDKTTTLVTAKKWLSYEIPKNTTLVAVVQAQNKVEAFDCYHILKMQGYKKIAFSYGADWYADECRVNSENLNIYSKKSLGRYNVIKEFYDKGLIEKTDRIHLLGCNLPQEFNQYVNMPFIETLDTSNPVIHGLLGIKYEDYGLFTKSPIKIDQSEEFTDKHWDTVVYNINMFKTFIN